MSGAVDLLKCPEKPGKCKCGLCAVCGFHKHMAVHGPIYGRKPRSRPWGHAFEPLTLDKLFERYSTVAPTL